MKEQKVEGGWITAEYSMLPYSTLTRKPRDISKGKLDGRSSEIQRLIGRSMRAAMDLEKIGARTICVDCDVLQADGGTRTAAITGAFVALSLAVKKLIAEKKFAESPIFKPSPPSSVGIVNGVPLLDLCYTEDVAASVDMNLVMNASGQFIELQGTGEEATFSEAELADLLALGKAGIRRIARRTTESHRPRLSHGCQEKFTSKNRTVTRLLLIRHGEVEDQYHKLFGGRIDMNLSAARPRTGGAAGEISARQKIRRDLRQPDEARAADVRAVSAPTASPPSKSSCAACAR